MKIIAKENFNLNGVFYEVGDEIKGLNREQLAVINERGFIEPLTPKQIQEFGKEENTDKKFKLKED